MSLTFSLAEARRLAIASQGFGPKPVRPTISQLRSLVGRLHALQIDSVTVLARAHYVPAFARLGPYSMSALDTLAYQKWELFEYLHPGGRVPRAVDARGIVTPFDSLVWARDRIDRLFGMKYTIEMYVPQAARVYGYYVCPFLLGDTLVARCDLKADRVRSTLIVQGAFAEAGQRPSAIAAHLLEELRSMQAWLRLDRLEVKTRGDLTAPLRRASR